MATRPVLHSDPLEIEYDSLKCREFEVFNEIRKLKCFLKNRREKIVFEKHIGAIPTVKYRKIVSQVLRKINSRDSTAKLQEDEFYNNFKCYQCSQTLLCRHGSCQHRHKAAGPGMGRWYQTNM